MAYPNPPRTWSAAAVLTAAQLNAELRDALNTIIPTASTTLAWGTYTPTLTQSATITKTVNKANYFQIGKIVVVSVGLTCTSSGTANNPVRVSLPVTAAAIAAVDTQGWGNISDGNNHPAVCYLATTTTVGFLDCTQVASVALGQTGSALAGALVSTNVVSFGAVYQAA